MACEFFYEKLQKTSNFEWYVQLPKHPIDIYDQFQVWHDRKFGFLAESYRQVSIV